MTESPEVGWRQQEYAWQDDDVEPLGNYHPGGFHPVNLGDTYCRGRYLIVNKLGFGTYSTVWLAKEQPQDRYVALKILSAEASDSCNEANILRRLRTSGTNGLDTIGEDCILRLLAIIHIHGPNGKHLCLVSEPAACSITYARELSTVWVFPLQIARAMVAKVIMGVHYLHNNDVVHGDLHIRNILFKSPDPESSYAALPPPTTSPIKRLDGAALPISLPSHAIPAAPCGQPCENTTNADLLIADFGEAYLSSGPQPQYLNTPYEYCPPEALLNLSGPTTPPPNGKATDIWALACTLVEILGTNPLFEGTYTDADDVLAKHISALGKPPAVFWQKWEKRGDFFDEEGNWDVKPPRRNVSASILLAERIARRMKAYGENLTNDEKGAIEGMLRGMLTYSPEERWTIEQVLECDWMKRYGKPAITALDARTDKNVIEDTGIVKGAPEVFTRKVVYLSASDSDESDEEIPVIARKSVDEHYELEEKPEGRGDCERPLGQGDVGSKGL
ncbi:MAG: hypothetical protein Q9169_005723 [Polycauliona sp. 2 TL-2023]